MAGWSGRLADVARSFRQTMRRLLPSGRKSNEWLQPLLAHDNFRRLSAHRGFR
jgi:hypothetical protein